MVGRVELANFLINNHIDEFLVDVDGKMTLVTLADFELDITKAVLVLKWKGVKK